MDIAHEATCCTNELFYRNGSPPQKILCTDADAIRDIIKRYLQEAFDAGRASEQGPEDHK